ncbi:hypothetical protein ACX3VG_17040, partial [Escherichia coli]
MENKSARAKVQAFGGFLTAMVIPNICLLYTSDAADEL